MSKCGWDTSPWDVVVSEGSCGTKKRKRKMKSMFSNSMSIRSYTSNEVHSRVERLLVKIEKIKVSGEGEGKKGFRYYTLYIESKPRTFYI